MPTTIGFRATPEDERILAEAQRDGETTSDVLRRALYLLARQARREQMWADMERIAASGEQVGKLPAAW